MKRGIVLVASLVTVSLGAQTYLPVLENGKTWSCYGDFFFINVKYRTGSDTLVNDRIWKKVMAHGSDFPFDFDSASAIYKSAVREEGGKVWVIEKNQQTENLLYDFTKSAGDTLRFYRPSGAANQEIQPAFVTGKVYKTDVVSFGGAARKRMFIHDPFIVDQLPQQALSQLDSQADIWIEGIGGKTGLFSRRAPWGVVGPQPYLLACVEAGKNRIYTNHTGYTSHPADECFIIPPGWITEIDKLAPGAVTIFPNPAEGHVSIHQHHTNLLTVTVYDMRGRQVFPEVHKSNGTLVEIDLESLNAGVFQLVVKTDASVVVSRLIHF